MDVTHGLLWKRSSACVIFWPFCHQFFLVNKSTKRLTEEVLNRRFEKSRFRGVQVRRSVWYWISCEKPYCNRDVSSANWYTVIQSQAMYVRKMNRCVFTCLLDWSDKHITWTNAFQCFLSDALCTILQHKLQENIRTSIAFMAWWGRIDEPINLTWLGKRLILGRSKSDDSRATCRTFTYLMSSREH